MNTRFIKHLKSTKPSKIRSYGVPSSSLFQQPQNSEGGSIQAITIWLVQNHSHKSEPNSICKSNSEMSPMQFQHIFANINSLSEPVWDSIMTIMVCHQCQRCSWAFPLLSNSCKVKFPSHSSFWLYNEPYLFFLPSD